MGRGKGHLNVSTCPRTANRSNANGSVTGFRTRSAARSGGDAAESLLPMVVLTRAAAAEAIAAHAVVDVAALDVTITKASSGGGRAGWCQLQKSFKFNTSSNVLMLKLVDKRGTDKSLPANFNRC
jgi:hypothetical protein